MSVPDRQQPGDGTDNYGQAVRQMAKAASQAGKETAKQAAAKGAEAAANTAAATVKASVEGGKAAAEIAAGTASGGPWGAIISAAWSLRHTLFKVLVCICLVLVFLIVLVISLPSIIFNSIFGLDGKKPAPDATPYSVYGEMSQAVSGVVENAYRESLDKAEKIILDGGYDYDVSMDELKDLAKDSEGYDISYILAAYSASMRQQNTKKEDMLSKLNKVCDRLFPVTYTERSREIIKPVTYMTYKPVSVTVVTDQVKVGSVNGSVQYRYETSQQTYYIPDGIKISEETVAAYTYEAVQVTVPINFGDSIVGTKNETYYKLTGRETLTPVREKVEFLECTIHPFDNGAVADAFGIDLNAEYEQFGITYEKAIENMARALDMTLYGKHGAGQSPVKQIWDKENEGK